ncbi:MAG TPA: hypothetical protein DHW02_10945, partial [Ktedonobacter sp.]|nr:hypothetical protein [Ktedonobacter sp.]
RLRPWWHDANQMLQDGADLRDWVTTGIEETQRYHGPVGNATAQTPPIQEQKLDEAPSDIPETCAVCKRSIYQDENNEFRFSPEGVLYCGTHYQIHVQSRDERHQHFLTTVARIASLFPGGCTMTVDPPDYTIDQRVQELQAEKLAQERARYEAMMQARYRRRAIKCEK